MAVQSVEPVSAGAPTVDQDSGLRYVARQPILDARGRVYGYELLFRNGPEAAFRGSREMATRTMLDNALLFGMERLTGGLPAFLNCTVEALNERLVELLLPSMTVLEIPEVPAPDAELLTHCRYLKRSGFRLAVGSYCWRDGFAPLMEIADFIKLDFTALSASGRATVRQRATGLATTLVAERLETPEDYRLARGEGFVLFQGYHFCHPELLKRRKVPVNQVSRLRILKHLLSEAQDVNELSRLVREDAALTYRLLRLVNSPVCAVRREVSSVESALVFVGEQMFRRMALLAITTELSWGSSPEVLRMALVRGRFCEAAAAQCGLNPSEQYLLGMLSLLPAMLQMASNEVTPVLPLRAEIVQALQGQRIRERVLLDWLESHERAQWAACDRKAAEVGMRGEELARMYAEALVWAEEVMEVAA